MKDNHHITQNQTVKININNSGNKRSNKRRNNRPKSVLGNVLGGGSGSGGGYNPTGGFGAPNILHNDNRPDISNLENTLQKVYDNQMTQHTYSNYIRDGYSHYPQIDAPHLTELTDVSDEHPVYKSRVEDLDDSDEERDFKEAPEERHEEEGGEGEDDDFPSPPASVRKEIMKASPFREKLKGRPRKHAIHIGTHQVKQRIKREIKLLKTVPESDKKQVLLQNIRADINHIHDVSNGEENLKDLLPLEYHYK